MLMASLKGEIDITMDVNSEHTVKMVEARIGSRYTYIILELCDTDLRKELASRKFAEPECVAASFSFDVNNAGPEPKQETVCLLQNGTQANNPSAKPAKKLNQYYMVKMSIRSGKVNA